MSEADTQIRTERPYAFAVFSIVVALSVSFGLVVWAASSPETVLVGEPGIHDARGNKDRLAGCLDCHVPFLGTPGSRCLSPSCHGNLATGTPKKTGPAMPIRFHSALATLECSHCHNEHGPKIRAHTDQFDHAIIPQPQLKQCSHCHSGAQQKSHSGMDTVQCSECHRIDNWKTETMDHKKIWQHACDVCHVAPDSPTHEAVAGTCSTCHETHDWTPQSN